MKYEVRTTFKKKERLEHIKTKKPYVIDTEEISVP